MKKINLKKVNKNTLCNVLIAVNVGTLVLNIINSKMKNKVVTKKKAVTQKDINIIYDYIDDIYDNVYEYIDDSIERNRIDAFRYVDNKLGEVDDKIERFRVDAFRYTDNKLDKNVKDTSTYIDDVLKLHSMDIKNTIEDKFDNLSVAVNPMGVKKPQ